MHFFQFFGGQPIFFSSFFFGFGLLKSFLTFGYLTCSVWSKTISTLHPTARLGSQLLLLSATCCCGCFCCSCWLLLAIACGCCFCWCCCCMSSVGFFLWGAAGLWQLLCCCSSRPAASPIFSGWALCLDSSYPLLLLLLWLLLRGGGGGGSEPAEEVDDLSWKPDPLTGSHTCR